MYSDWMNAAPLTFQLKMRVHYSSNYENAFWDGSAMTFGDGRNTFYPLVSLDVSAHEVSHGYTEQNSGLVYSGKSGGLNESFSDVAGEAAEYYMTGTNDWMVGEQIFKANGALRYMDDPTRDGRSIGHQSDYSSGMDVHYSSGVFNKAFYLLANKSGWDTKKAFLAYATANKLYWTSNTNWDNAGSGVMDAACDLGYDTDDVQDALASVGVTSNVSPGSECGDGGGGGEDPVLENGVPVTGISGSAKEQKFFTMAVPAGATNLTFNTSGGSGDADLYVKYGSKPTLQDYDCRSITSSSTESCTMGNIQTGTYHVMVEAWNAISGVSLVGSYSTDGDNSNSMDNGVPKSGLSASTGDEMMFTMDVPEGSSNVTFTMSGGTGDADLYVKFGSAPTDNDYDCRPYLYGNNETCTGSSSGGTYYARILAYSSFSGVNIVGNY
jgi:vibriolysin